MLREAWKLLRGVVDGKYCPEVWLLASGLSAQAMTKMQSALEERVARRQELLNAEGTDWGGDRQLEELEYALELVERKQAVCV